MQPMILLFIMPILLLASTYIAFQILPRRFGMKLGYFIGFVFYWGIWCLGVPLLLVGPRGILDFFRNTPAPLGNPAWLGLA